MPTTPPTALPPEQLLVTIPTAAKMLSISTRSIYNIIARGQLPLRHVGRASRVSLADLRAYAESLSAPVEAKR